jgi:alpha-mannosidase
MDFDQEQAAPRSYGGPAKIRVVENGPVRVAVEVSREGEGSKFVQTVRLSAETPATASSLANPSTGSRSPQI